MSPVRDVQPFQVGDGLGVRKLRGSDTRRTFGPKAPRFRIGKLRKASDANRPDLQAREVFDLVFSARQASRWDISMWQRTRCFDFCLLSHTHRKRHNFGAGAFVSVPVRFSKVNSGHHQVGEIARQFRTARFAGNTNQETVRIRSV